MNSYFLFVWSHTCNSSLQSHKVQFQYGQDKFVYPLLNGFARTGCRWHMVDDQIRVRDGNGFLPSLCIRHLPRYASILQRRHKHRFGTKGCKLILDCTFDPCRCQRLDWTVVQLQFHVSGLPCHSRDDNNYRQNSTHTLPCYKKRTIMSVVIQMGLFLAALNGSKHSVATYLDERMTCAIMTRNILHSVRLKYRFYVRWRQKCAKLFKW